MDLETKMESLALLKKLALDKLILIIEHNDEVSECLDGKIIVLKTKEGSSLVTSYQNNVD